MSIEPNAAFWMWLIIGIATGTLVISLLVVFLLKVFVFKATEKRARRVADAEGRFDLIEQEDVAEILSTLSPKKKEAFMSSAIKEQFISNLGHELRTPLNTILGFSEALLEEVEDEKSRDDIKRIWRAGDHLNRVITDFVFLYRLDSGRLSLSREKILIRGILAEIIEDVSDLCELGHNKISYEVDEGAEQFISDPEKIKLVLSNLVHNACKFTKNGTIDIHVSRVGKKLEVSVKDTGVGIDERNMAQIFESFQTVDRGPHEIRGSGLGLSIAKKVAKFMGGDIAVESSLGDGSCFKLSVLVDD